MFGNRDIMSRDLVFVALAKKGIARVEVEYNGGNDEGGVDQITFFDKDDKKIGEMQEYYGGHMFWDEATKSYKPAAPPNEEQRLSQALCAPVYDKYGSFAGEFYVNGTLTWDVAKKKIKDHGVESVEHEESFDDEL
jgi:hypothetical protein